MADKAPSQSSSNTFRLEGNPQPANQIVPFHESDALLEIVNAVSIAPLAILPPGGGSAVKTGAGGPQVGSADRPRRPIDTPLRRALPLTREDPEERVSVQ